jgi:hypothetical protein
MESAMHWAWLDIELRRWRAAGRRAALWWRDDDAQAPTAELDRLLEIRAGTPLTLAVIPDGDMAGLAVRLAGTVGVSVVQHGVDHQNRRRGAVAGEFPPEWRRLRVATQVRAGWRRMAALPAALQVFVPPWNDVHAELPAVLADCDYLGWSAWGDGLVGDGSPPRIDAHLDLMRWKGGARFRGEAKFLGELRGLLAARRLAGRWDAPIGLLTHHLAHDEAAWAFLGRFVAWSGSRSDVAWNALPDLIDGRRAEALTA